MRGKLDVLKAFLAVGKRVGEFKRELRRRQALLDALPAPVGETSSFPRPAAGARAA